MFLEWFICSEICNKSRNKEIVDIAKLLLCGWNCALEQRSWFQSELNIT